MLKIGSYVKPKEDYIKRIHSLKGKIGVVIDIDQEDDCLLIEWINWTRGHHQELTTYPNSSCWYCWSEHVIPIKPPKPVFSLSKI